MTVNRAKRALQNAFSGTSGALGDGDRGAWQRVPTSTGNPYDFVNYIDRWRQYCHLYEISWEARKIIRIPVEDALRKPWKAEDIPEEISKKIQNRLDQLNFHKTLSRSLMLERLLGGCLTFMGLEAKTDDVSKPFHPREGARLRFLNAIPISRINRMNWDNDPLSEHYMRPNEYIINGNPLHVSRCIVWDGEPLFDPYDFALMNFRANLAGFGPSKLVPIWDDIVRTVGTRQAAFQMIQTNNALIMAVKDLQSLMGTTPGGQVVTQLKAIANQISLYRAALIEKDKIELSQSAASFGSVPELIIAFIQVLAAASDIPATRFLGQAPGGLNATGESDLENYYNTIDSFQRLRIEPCLRRIYDVIGYQMFPGVWKAEREKLTFKFPPLWNLKESEEADLATKRLDNAIKAYQEGVLGPEKLIDELNAANVFTVDLDEKDLDLMDQFDFPPGRGEEGGETPPESGGQTPPVAPTPPKPSNPVGGLGEGLEGPKNVPGASGGIEPKEPPDGTPRGMTKDGQFKRTKFNDKVENKKAEIPESVALAILSELGITDVTPKQLAKGMTVELEHLDVTGGDLLATAKIALVHFEECPDYYERLEKYVENGVPWDSVNKYPTKAQRRAGNYKKAHLYMHGYEISIENPKGSERQGMDANGNEWSSILPADYGYIRRAEGADGDQLDVYIGPHENSEEVYVVDQKDIETGEFDEHKVIFGALGMTQAKQLYLDAFSDGQGNARLLALTPLNIEEFKQWVDNGDLTQPYKQGESE